MAIRKILSILILTCLSGCVSMMDFNRDSIKDVFVLDFESKEQNCDRSSVGVNHTDARKFFQNRATMMTKRQIDVYYPYVMCYAMGSLVYMGAVCEWKIYASGTGNIKCKDRTWYFACDDCDDLLHKDFDRVCCKCPRSAD